MGHREAARGPLKRRPLEESLSPESASLRLRHGQRDQRESRRPSSPFSGDARLELRQQELVVEAVDGGDVGEDARDHVLRDSSLCELSAKYLRRKKNPSTRSFTNTPNRGRVLEAGMQTPTEKFPCC